MREDGWLIGYGMATAGYGVPAVEHSHAALPAALWACSCLLARGADRAGDHLDRAPAPRLAVKIRLGRGGHPCRSLQLCDRQQAGSPRAR